MTFSIVKDITFLERLSLFLHGGGYIVVHQAWEGRLFRQAQVG